MHAILIFVKPPSLDTLRERLMNRGTEGIASIEKRVSFAKSEIERGGKYDYLVVNDSLPLAYEVLRSIFIAEDHRNS